METANCIEGGMLNKRKWNGDGVMNSKCQRIETNQGLDKCGDASKKKNCRIKVYVRARPLKQNEPNAEVIQIPEEEPRTSLIFDPKVVMDPFYFRGEVQTMRDITKKVKKNQLFEFDEVFSDAATNRQVFDSTAKNIVGSILEGFNCSVFAYGATGAGKTYTMLGKEDCPGISYLTLKELLKHIDSNQEKLKIASTCSYIEVYNEVVRDLLNPKGKQLELREESGGGTVISGLRIVPITDTNQLYTLLESGNKQRTQHPTDANAESSRSHAIFQVRVRMQEKVVGGQVKIAKLTMIDLAGSERGCATGYKGKQFKEGSSINKSLLALGNCINALADGQKYVPYRDSKLTRILKDSLGGNCQTMMIANISPSQSSYDETYNTLKYATRARSITTTANQNFINTNMNVGQCMQLMNQLKIKLGKSENEMSDFLSWKADVERIMGQRSRLVKEIMTLESQKKITEWRLNKAVLSQNLSPTEILPERINGSMEQWRSRVDTLKNRLEEYNDLVKSNMADKQRIEDRMIHICKHVSDQTKEFYNNTFSMWEGKVKNDAMQANNQHLMTLTRVLAKNDETLSSFRDDTMLFLSECFNLLQAYNHATVHMKTQYDLTLKRLHGIKYVSWDNEERNDDNPTLSYYQQLVMPGQSNNIIPAPVPEVLKARHVDPSSRTRSMLKLNDKKFVSPLRTLQPASKILTKVTKTPVPKVSRQLILNINKENEVNQPTKKTFGGDKKISRKRTPLKLNYLRNAI